MIASSLIPKAAILPQTVANLTGILRDIQNDWHNKTREATSATYDIDFGSEESLVKLITSFSLLSVYKSLPPYYRGMKEDSDGIPYAGRVTPLDRVTFMRQFLRSMLSLRGKVGVVAMFDSIMGLLQVPSDKFVLLQDFKFYDQTTGDTYVIERKLYTSPLAEEESFNTYKNVPDNAEVLRGVGTSYYTPTNTLQIDVLTNIVAALGSEFLQALRVLTAFLKPTHVVFKGIAPAVYLQSTGQYNITRVQPWTAGESTAQRFTASANIIIEQTASFGYPTWVLRLTSGAEWTTVLPAAVQGLLVLIQSSMLIKNNRYCRILAVEGDKLHMAEDYSEGMVATLVGEDLDLIFDIDHTIREGLQIQPELTVSMAITIVGEQTIATAGNFVTQGFKEGSLLTTVGLDKDLHFLDEAYILEVTNTTMLIDKPLLQAQAVSTVVLKQYPDNWGDQGDSAELRRPYIQNKRSNMTPVIYQTGEMATLATGGVTLRGQEVRRTASLDTTHYDTVGSKGGGRIYLGFEVTGLFYIEFGYIRRDSGSWITDGFNVGDLITLAGFSNGANNVTAKISSIAANTIGIASVILVNEIPAGAVTISMEMSAGR